MLNGKRHMVVDYGSHLRRESTMALISPSIVPSLQRNGGWYREIDVMERLKDALPDSYEIFHSINWHTVQQESDRHGEIDLVVLGPTGNVLLMEVKAGDVVLRDGEIFKLYSDQKEHNVGNQCRYQYSAVVNRLQEAGLRPYVTNCLVLPDYVISNVHLLAVPRERIIDANGYDTIGTRVKEMMATVPRNVDREVLRHFFSNEFRVSTKLTVLRDQVITTTEQLSDGLATWIPKIAAPSRTLRIQATAGSGKTLLAIRLLEDAVARGDRAIYVCFNRSLADYMARIVPAKAFVANYHELCVDHYRLHYEEPDFADPSVFSAVVEAYVRDSESFPAKYDLLLIDEGQDFEPEWVDSLLPQLKGDGNLYLLEDTDQQLYGRSEFDLPEAVTIRCNDNFRSPRAVCRTIDAFALASSPIRSRGFYEGSVPGFHTYASDEDVVGITAGVVEGLLQQGFAIDDIVVLTGRGVKKSVVLKADSIGNHKTRRFTGVYSGRTGLPEWTEGELLVESVYRYKGQFAPAVVITEVDFAEMTAPERRKLFVGMTRAMMAVEIVLSRNAETCFAALLQQ